MATRTTRLGGLALAAGFAATLALAPGISAAQDLSGKTVKLGAIVPSSGPFAEWGRTNTVTLEMLEKEVNDAGGVNGATLEIIIYDDSAQPAQAANSMRKLGGDDEVLAVAGPLTSSAAEVTFPVANQVGIVATSQASSKPGVAANNRPWAFRNTVDEAILAKTSVPYFKETFGVEDVAIIYDAKDAVSTAIATRIMPGVMQENGIEVLNGDNPLSFNTGDLDVSAQVTNLKSLEPDGVVIGADYSEAITILREMNRQGLVVPVIGGTPLISSAILAAAPEIPLIAPATFYPGLQTERAQEFVQKLKPLLLEASGLSDDIEPSMYDANIYEIMQMYIDAVQKEGVTADPADLESDRTKIREHMEQLTDYEGLGGPISFNENGDAVKAFYIVQGQGGSWETKVEGCSADDESRC